jgi:hypothetical protein
VCIAVFVANGCCKQGSLYVTDGGVILMVLPDYLGDYNRQFCFDSCRN